jgi:hypothetical protein
MQCMLGCRGDNRPRNVKELKSHWVQWMTSGCVGLGSRWRVVDQRESGYDDRHQPQAAP